MKRRDRSLYGLSSSQVLPQHCIHAQRVPFFWTLLAKSLHSSSFNTVEGFCSINTLQFTLGDLCYHKNALLSRVKREKPFYLLKKSDNYLVNKNLAFITKGLYNAATFVNYEFQRKTDKNSRSPSCLHVNGYYFRWYWMFET